MLLRGVVRAIRTRWALLAAGMVALAAFVWVVLPPPAHAVAGIEGTFEYAIDAPWRIEPKLSPLGGGVSYGAIPIQISIHDANNVWRDQHEISEPFEISLGKVCKVTVRERGPSDGPGDPPSGPTTTIPFVKLDEVEYTRGRWAAPGEPYQDVPEHALCRAWAGQNCAGFDRVGGSSEWHASFDYTPSQIPPSRSVSLQVEVLLTKDPLSSCEIVFDFNRIRIVNELSVYFAPAPLPKFGPEWLYGDLHYHSQGTDNEGESAYNYRGVIRAMGAMGLDFAFATEHASNSQQIVDIDAKLGDIFGIELPPEEIRAGLRDMSKPRWDVLHGLLHGPGGADLEAPLLTGLAGTPKAPQIFLGGEVDLIPELPPGTVYGDKIPWGNHQEWSTENLCVGTLLDLGGPFTIDCESLGANLLEKTAENPDAVLVDDVQGFSVDFGRHHIAYLPRSAQDTGAFVSSDTGSYGGASRRFVDLKPELEKHGYFFAAHPVYHFERGDDFMTDPGPTDMPWTDHLYDQVWRSPAWLGLQFWNEDTRLAEEVRPWSAFTTTDPLPSAEHCALAYYDMWGTPVYICPEAGDDKGYERYDSPALGVPYAYLPVDRPQAGFGSGLFHLDVAPPVTGRWTEYVEGTEEKLHHGAFTWDRLNHWGLDVRKTQELGWLPSFLAPRKLLVAGGSDAHGDLNYRRTGYVIRTDKINDTALGRPRNLVEAGAPQGGKVPPGRNPKLPVHSQTQVTDAIAKGRFSVTDGPALRIAVDRNATQTIDPTDAQMGDVVRLPPGKFSLPVLVEWKSTPEFGRVVRIDLYVGARQSRDDLLTPSLLQKVGRTYAPPGPGVYHSSIPGIGEPDTIVEAPPYNRMNDYYWKDPTGLLRFQPANGFQGTKRIVLDLRKFPAMDNLPADRFFVRAFAMTAPPDPGGLCVADHESCLRRYAFTNPIWVTEDTYVCGAEAALDHTAPKVLCNAPATITAIDLPASFTATATDVCPVRIQVSGIKCTSKTGSPSPGCSVSASGSTVTVASGGPVGSVIRWSATATDAAGNRKSAACRTTMAQAPEP
jgi:hypothetical protein